MFPLRCCMKLFLFFALLALAKASFNDCAYPFECSFHRNNLLRDHTLTRKLGIHKGNKIL